ncbi:hypothetical protein ANN_13994 [Periplaneta americana]|uniref:DUF4708 domain-containing protein n=1 Tax=Periplaneta americana TaxID=6978 RepID=A0ABQ8SV33_PERAM|nr:hypothetical protein ANN_13994 [Periplaneta americana]
MCCIVGYVTCSEKYDSSAKSDYHWQIFRCRQLIFSESEIIASPSNGKDGAIYIVMTDDFYRTGKVQLLLEKLHITSRSPEPVSNVIYEACVRYTLVARISPLWNQVDCYLIQGRDFLLSTSALNAIKLEVITRDGDMFMSVWPLRIRLPQLQKENMDMVNNCGEQCVSVLPRYCLCQSFFMIKILCLILKKVRVRALSPHIPDSCPFKTYKELKRHWKNMYGYRLPEKPEKLFFCSLSFHSLSPILYTYPSLCVRQHDLVFLRHMDHNTVLQTFLKNLAIKLPTLCGYPFGVESRIVYAVPKLCHWSEVCL